MPDEVTILPRLSAEDKAAMSMFFEVYVEHFDRISEYTREALRDHPEMGTIIKSVPVEQAKRQSAENLQRIKKIMITWDWGDYIVNLLQQGEVFARMGLTFGAWFEAIKEFRVYLMPILAQRYKGEELIKAINGMWSFMDIAIGYLGVSYLNEKRRIIEEQRDRQAKLIRELESFAYIISHDLKAPLRGIATVTDWITDDYKDKLDETGKENLKLLKNRVDRMSNLIDGVLQYSRVGRFNVGRTEVELNALIADVIDSLSPSPTIKIRVEGKLPTMHFNKTSISQVFENLVGNAIKYMDKPEGEITIGCEDDEKFWKFYVKDNGPGIEEKYFEKIFEIFQTLNPRDEIESTGIGLSIVKKIVDSAGGKVWLTSEVGKGTAFYFTLPK